MHLAWLGSMEPWMACTATRVWAVGIGLGRSLESIQAIFVLLSILFVPMGVCFQCTSPLSFFDAVHI